MYNNNMSPVSEKVIAEIQEEFDVNQIYAQRLFSLVSGPNWRLEVAKIVQDKPKPFVKWVGGKRQLLKQFRMLDLYPPEKFDINKARYFEPFVGGGAVFFDLLPEKAFLSDLNRELITAYSVIKNDVEKLITHLNKHEINKDYFLDVRAQNISKLSDVEIASRFIFLNRTCFNGLYRVNSKGGFNVPYGKYTNPLICDETNLRKVSRALKKVQIQENDYKWVLNKAKNGDFLYFDPPYYPKSKTSSFTSYTAKGFFEKEQTELRDTFLKLHDRGCFVMLSNSDTPYINELYANLKGITVTKVHAGRMINAKASGRGKITEVLVTNY